MIEHLIAVKLPSGWEEMPLDPGEARRALRENARASGWAEQDVHLLEPVFSSALIEAVDMGLVFSASYLDPPRTEETLGLVASLFVGVQTMKQGMSDLPVVAWQAAVELAVNQGSLELLKKPEVCSMAGRDAVKVVSLEKLVETPRAEPMDLFAVTFYSALPGTGSALFVGFRTPCVWVADEFEVLFEAIASTVEVTEVEAV